MTKESVILIVPCYNEEEVLPLFYEEFKKTAELLKEFDLQVFFVDDGSQDRTLALIRQMAEKDKRVRYISFSRNFGKEAAIYAGLKNADGDYVALMDADLQDPPSLLPKMLKAVREEGLSLIHI